MNFYYVVSVCQCRDTHHKLTDPISHSEWGCMSPSLSTEILCESPTTCKHAATVQKHDGRNNRKLGIRNRGETRSSVIL